MPVIDNPEVRHERSDVNIRGIVIFAIALVLTAVVVHIGLYGLLEHYGEFTLHTRRAPAPITDRSAWIGGAAARDNASAYGV